MGLYIIYDCIIVSTQISDVMILITHIKIKVRTYKTIVYNYSIFMTQCLNNKILKHYQPQ